MVKHMTYKGYRVPIKDSGWYNYYLGLYGDGGNGDDVRNLIDLCISDDPMELMYRYLLVRRNRAARNEDVWLKEFRSRVDKDRSNVGFAEEMYEFWKEQRADLQRVVNFMVEVIGLDVLALWGQATGEKNG